MQRFVLILATLLTLSLHGLALACPNCKETISQTDAAAAPNLPAGFNFSIYYMLVGLFCVMGLVARVIVKGIRDSQIAAPDAEPKDSETSSPPTTATATSDTAATRHT